MILHINTNASIGFFAFGFGGWYRAARTPAEWLARGMRLLDTAVGTGLVARAALRITANDVDVIGLDASQGMLRRPVVRWGFQ